MSVRERHYYAPADLASTPDDGQRYEIIDGSLLVTPMAGGEHQRTVMDLALQLHAACPPGLVVLPGAELHLGDDAVIPDVVVVRDRPVLPAAFSAADVVLVVEVTSQHQQGRDRVTKRAVYQRAGIPTYIIAGPSGLLLLELRDGRYVEVASAASVELSAPFPLSLRALS